MDKNTLQITLMRHGEALGSPDIRRQLTDTGRADTAQISELMTDLEVLPDFVLCSGVDRTRQTLESLNIKHIPVQYCGEDLYRAESAREVLNIIAENIPAHARHPLIIGHNPTIHEAATYLSRESDPKLVRAIQSSYAPSTACVFECMIDNWDMLHPATSQLIHVLKAS